MSSSLPNMETAWKQEVNERLAAHRTRRTRRDVEHPTLPGMESGDPLKSSIAARVAARYAQAPTYSEMLAAEAQNAANAAAAAARAANQAQAAAQAILTGLDLRDETHVQGRVKEAAATATGRRSVESRNEIRNEGRSETGSQTRREPWQDSPPPIAPVAAQVREAPVAHGDSAVAASPLRILMAEEAEDRVEYETPQPIPANLIEFPRELFATRRARPRLAEGPLREEADSGKSQLRIFEVEPESISTTPLVARMETEWSSIRLGAHPAHDLDEGRRREAVDPQRHEAAAVHSQRHATPLPERLELPLQTASLEDRSMAAIVDFALVTAAFLLFVLVFAACTATLPAGKTAVAGGALCLFAIALVYQALFFAFAESTPGMRYAKIALCTFEDENPTRNQMRLRVASMLLSLCPLGLGCLWIFFDEDHLSWHDRITRTYQRSYR